MKLDGLSTVVPTITGTHVDFATGTLADGPHTLSATLTDLTGKTSPILLHFTVYTPGTTPTPPYVEKNTRSGEHDQPRRGGRRHDRRHAGPRVVADGQPGELARAEDRP